MSALKKIYVSKELLEEFRKAMDPKDLYCDSKTAEAQEDNLLVLSPVFHEQICLVVKG